MGQGRVMFWIWGALIFELLKIKARGYYGCKWQYMGK